MSRILRHVGNKDFKRTRQRQIGEQKERAAQKLKEWKEAEAERKQIEEIARPFKSYWRKETQLQESDWTPVAGSIANSSAQTFHYATPNLETGEPIAVNVSGLGGVESVPSAVTIDSGFGDISSVDAPNYSQLALQGYAPLLQMQKRGNQTEDERIDAEIRKLEEQIKQLDQKRSDIEKEQVETEPQYTGMTPEEYADRDNEIGEKWADKMWPLQKKLNDNPACIAADKCTGTKAELFRMSELMTQELEDFYNEYERQTSEFQKAQEYWFAQQEAENKARQDALDEIDNEKDPYSDLLGDLGELLEKLRREGKLIKRWEIVGPGEEGYVDTTNMANAIGYNRRPIYTARAEELMKQLGAAQDAQLEWMNAQQKKREAAEKANYKGGQGGLPIGSTSLRGGAGDSAGARKPTPPENMSQSAALARQAAFARANPQQRRKNNKKYSTFSTEETTWSRLKKYR